MKFALVLCIVLVFFTGMTSPQESESDAVPSVDDGQAAPTTLEKCFTAPRVTDMSVMSDQHVYIRTRGNNHYLMTTEYCENLERSYQRGSARFVAYGRTVCQNDGSYVVYDAGGRELPCSVLTIERVQNRAEARRLAEELAQLVETEDVTPAE